MKMRKKLALVFIFILVLSMAIPTQAAVKISKKSITLTVGKKKTLKIIGTKKKVKWSSSKKSVATVSSKGVVTAKKKGTATITAKAGKKKYTCKVTVKNSSSIKMLFPSQDECGEGTFYIYFASGTSENGNIPCEYVDKTFLTGFVDYCAYGVDNSVPIHVYVDGKQIDVTYVGYRTQSSKTIEGDSMKKGIHVVEMVQYKNDNTSGEIITYRVAKYKIMYK